MGDDSFALVRGPDCWRITFAAMASPCEILVDSRPGDTESALRYLGEAAVAETRRIEALLSRYRPDNIIHRINTAGGLPVTVDEETASLLDFASRCHVLSQGRFDITSGILRRVWTFDGGNRIPKREDVRALLPMVGWHKVDWRRPVLRLPAGMEIDLGGIGKEYAVDRVANLVLSMLTARPGSPAGLLVNFGGDLRVMGARRKARPWRVGVERPGLDGVPSLELELQGGGLATSGDARRYVLRDGVRYGHILDPTTGWPVPGAPRSVTVLADSCTSAGLLATLAMLEGEKAEEFLSTQDVRHWIIR